MAELINVMAGKVDDRVVLWEVHPDHPDGEIWLVADGQAYTVAHTQQVETRLKSGALIRVELYSELDPPVETDDVQVESVLPDGYETMTVADVLATLDSWTEEQINTIREYEQAHKGRKTILEAIG